MVSNSVQLGLLIIHWQQTWIIANQIHNTDDNAEKLHYDAVNWALVFQ